MDCIRTPTSRPAWSTSRSLATTTSLPSRACKVKTTGKPGSGFADNTVDAIYLFHDEGGAWKLWDETVLGIEILPETAPAEKP